MKKWIGWILAAVFLLTNCGLLSVFAEGETETKSVPLVVTAAYYQGDQLVVDENWRDHATYTYTVTDGVPAETGTLSNGLYSFSYTPASGRLFKFSFASGVANTTPIVVPHLAGAFSLENGTQYQETEINLYVSEAKYAPFYQKSVKHIIISEGVTTLANSAIRQPAQGFLTLQLPTTLKTIGNNTCQQNTNKGLSEVNFPPNLTSIGSNAFTNTRIKEAVLPAGITKISNDTFNNCSEMKRVVFEGNITSIGTNAFRQNFALSEMVFWGETAPQTMNPINASVSTLTVYYPSTGTGYTDEEKFRSFFPSGTKFEEISMIPVAEGITIEGSPVIGETLTGRYGAYTDATGRPEGDSYCVWSCADDPGFTQNVTELQSEPIRAGGTSVYAPAENEIGKYIRFSVIPVAEGERNTIGEPAFFTMSEPVRTAQRSPRVSITSHRSGDVIPVNEAITLTSSAVCDGAEVTKVEYYINNEKIGEATQAPYAVTWTAELTGPVSLTARAFNNYDETGESEVCRLLASPVTGMKLLGQNGITEVGSLLDGNNSVTASALFQNTAEVDQAANAMIAAYDGNGNLLTVCTSEKYTIPAGAAEFPIAVTLPLTDALIAQVQEIKAYVWDIHTGKVFSKAHHWQFAESSIYDQLRMKWKVMLTGGDNFDQSNPYIQEKTASITASAQSLWNSMNHAEDRTYIFSSLKNVLKSESDMWKTFSRLKTMALAHETVGSDLYKNEGMRTDIISALEWMNQKVYSSQFGGSGNWWNWQIGAPQDLIDISVLLYDYLDTDQVGRYMAAVGRHQNDISMTGANRMWECKVFAGRGILVKDGSLLDMVKSGMSNIFVMVTKDDGFYEDGSFLQHHNIAYNGGYGLSLIDCIADIMYILDSSAWEINEIAGNNVFRWVVDAYEPFIYRGALMDFVRGREISREGTSTDKAGHQAMSAILRLSQFAPEKYAGQFKSMVKYWLQSNPEVSYFPDAPIDRITLAVDILNDPSVSSRGELIAYRQFYGMDRAVQFRPGYGLALSMHSSRIANYESINSENGSAHHTGDGMLYLYNDDVTQFSGTFWPTVNRYRLPGTTVLKNSTVKPNQANSRDWAGGSELDGLFGTSGMDLQPYGQNMNAKKSWFFFDDEVVALGAGITSSDGIETETIIENRKLRPGKNNQFLIDGAAKAAAMGTEETTAGARWAHLEGNVEGADIGYYFPEGETLHTLRENRKGKWSSINSGSSTVEHNDDYLTMWVSHGTNPENEDYAYVLLPNKNTEETRAYAQAPSVHILANTASLQAAEEKSAGLLGANFWEDGVQTAGILTCNKKASVTLQRTDDQLSIALSDPTQKNTGTIEIELAAEARGVLRHDSRINVTQLSPTIKFTADVNTLRGRSLSAVFDLSGQAALEPENDTYIIDNTDPGFSTDGSSWPASTSGNGYLGANYFTDGTAGADTDRWARWTPEIQKADTYDVYIRWASESSAPSGVPIEVHYDGGTDTRMNINQKSNGGFWIYVGSYPFREGTDGYIQIQASRAGKTVADAVKLVARNAKGNTSENRE